jgi:subtilase family serine protease
VPKPSWQTDTATCARRTVADVAAVADPATGVAVYDSYGSSGGANWYVFGGTSVAAPIVASVYALAGNTASISNGSYPYSHSGSLFDVTSGTNGQCTYAYLCTAVAGYDGPTGRGTPNGVAAF